MKQNLLFCFSVHMCKPYIAILIYTLLKMYKSDDWRWCNFLRSMKNI